MTAQKSIRAALAAGSMLAPLAIAMPASADEGATQGDATRIVVTAHMSGTTIEREDLSRGQAGSSDTAALLARLPGVSAATGGGFSSMPSIRGLSEQRLTILVDGQAIDMSCPNDMNSPLSYTDPQTVASIQVLTGVAPVSSGGDNIGGVISVENTPPLFAASDTMLATGEASSFYRSNGDGFGGAVKLTAASRSLSATYTGSYIQSDQYQGGGDDGIVRSTEYAKTDHALALAWQGGSSVVQLKGGFQYSPYEGFVNQFMDMVENKSWFINGSYRGVFGWGTLDFAASYRDTDHEMDFLEDKLPGSMPMNTEVHSFDSSARLEVPVNMHHTLRFGGEYHYQWLDDYWPPVAGSMMMGPNAYVNVNEATRDRIGAYAEWQAHWSDSLQMVAGIRYDVVEMDTGEVQPYGTDMMQMDDVMAAAAFNAADRQRTDHNWSGSILMTWQASEIASLEVGYAHKARSPNIYERYSWGRGAMASQMIGWYGDGNGYVGNLDLKPERADTVSLALALGGKPQGWSLRISPYYTHVSDYIDAVFVKDLTGMMMMPTPFVQLQFANQEAEFYGVDVSGGIDLRRGEGGDATRLNASFAWLHANNLSDGGPVYRQMPFDARVWLEHRQGPLKLFGEVEWVAEKTRVDSTRNEPTTDDYALVNIGAAYSIGGVRLSVEAQNLFDTAYALPLGGLSLGDFGATGDLRPVPGRGRSINVGISTRF